MGLLGEHKGCQQIERYDFLGELRTRLSSGDRWTTTRVVNQDIQAPIPFLDGIDNSLRCGRVANVRTKEGGDVFVVGNGRSGLATTHGDHLGTVTQQCSQIARPM